MTNSTNRPNLRTGLFALPNSTPLLLNCNNILLTRALIIGPNLVYSFISPFPLTLSSQAKLTVTIITPRCNLGTGTASLRHSTASIQMYQEIMIAYLWLAATFAPKVDGGSDRVWSAVRVVICVICAGGGGVAGCRCGVRCW